MRILLFYLTLILLRLTQREKIEEKREKVLEFLKWAGGKVNWELFSYNYLLF